MVSSRSRADFRAAFLSLFFFWELCRKLSDGMFLKACREVAKEYPEVAYDEDLLDRTCLRVRPNLSSSLPLPLVQISARLWLYT